MRKFQIVVFFILFATLSIGGGYEHNGGCDEQPIARQNVPEADVPPPECQDFLAVERQAGYKAGYEAGLKAGKKLASAEQAKVSETEVTEEKVAKVKMVQETFVIRNYKIPKGGSIGGGVDKFASQGANLDATLHCNGHKIGTRKNIVVFPGESIKICGWTSKFSRY